MSNKVSIYLDDVRTPISKEWIVVRDYDEFVDTVIKYGFENIDYISLDHDLGESAMAEYYRNVAKNFTLDYNNITEKTGYDCAKWLIDYYYSNYNNDDNSRSEKKENGITFPMIYVHSANPIGSANIIGYINNFYKNEGQSQICLKVNIPHTT